MSFSDKQIKELENMGKDWAADYAHDVENGSYVEPSDGQSEAQDLAAGMYEGIEAECAADIVYEGIMKEWKRRNFQPPRRTYGRR